MILASIPSSKDLVEEAVKLKPSGDVNEIHGLTYELMMNYKTKYYETKVDDFLSRMTLADIPTEMKKKLREEMLSPVTAKGVPYSNFMEEASRRISQTFQVTSGNIAELCVARELGRVGLEEHVHYRKKFEGTDFLICSPDLANERAKHRVEVKNVKLRERGARGLAFDGDSMLGFFDSPSEFSQPTVRWIDAQVLSTNGYCYVPPLLLEQMQYRGNRFRPNSQIGLDMQYFVQNGRMP